MNVFTYVFMVLQRNLVQFILVSGSIVLSDSLSTGVMEQ